MSGLRSRIEVLGKDDAGRAVVRVAFAGDYAAGSGGNEAAKEIRELVQVVREQHGASALVIDLGELEYRFGDALAWALREPREAGVDVAVVAHGETEQALRGLFAYAQLDTAFGVRLFGTVAEASALFLDPARAAERRTTVLRAAGWSLAIVRQAGGQARVLLRPDGRPEVLLVAGPVAAVKQRLMAALDASTDDRVRLADAAGRPIELALGADQRAEWGEVLFNLPG